MSTEQNKEKKQESPKKEKEEAPQQDQAASKPDAGAAKASSDLEEVLKVTITDEGTAL